MNDEMVKYLSGVKRALGGPQVKCGRELFGVGWPFWSTSSPLSMTYMTYSSEEEKVGLQTTQF